MPLPIIANTYQAVLNWTNTQAPRDAANILHFFDDVGGQTELDLKNDMVSNADQIMFQAVTSNARVNELRITKLDGIRAGQRYAIPVDPDFTGGGGTDAILQGAQVVSLRSNQRGPRGRNRVFLPWIAEDRQLNGVITPAVTANVANAWAGFLAAMTMSGWRMVAASALYQQQNAVTTIAVSSSLHTQRRRARR